MLAEANKFNLSNKNPVIDEILMEVEEVERI